MNHFDTNRGNRMKLNSVLLEPISKLLSAAIGCKARGTALSAKRVLNVLQYASEPFSSPALPTTFSLNLASKSVLKWVIVLALTSAALADFTIGVITDAQYLSQSENGGDMMKAMTQFFPDRKEELNLVHVASLGDMTDDLVVDAQWQRSRSSYDIFPHEEISYSPCQGNHGDMACLNKWFPVSDFKKYPQFGGYFRGIESD